LVLKVNQFSLKKIPNLKYAIEGENNLKVETETTLKNGANPKSQMSRKTKIIWHEFSN